MYNVFQNELSLFGLLFQEQDVSVQIRKCHFAISFPSLIKKLGLAI